MDGQPMETTVVMEVTAAMVLERMEDMGAWEDMGWWVDHQTYQWMKMGKWWEEENDLDYDIVR